MTNVARCVLATLVVPLVAATASGARSNYVYRRVVFVAVSGRGHVVSRPRGISCPTDCRSARFMKDEQVSLVARPAPGWSLVRWSGSCTGRAATCTFWLTDSHDCAHGACPIGAFGEHVAFVRGPGG